MARIAVDAMGTDRGPAEIVAGAVLAAEAGFDVTVVGDKAIVEPLLDGAPDTVGVVHAPDVIEMDEDPARALRDKPDSSVVTAAKLVREGEADGMVVAGSTGAALAASTIVIGRISGVLRPAIAAAIPAPNHSATMIDAGANPDVRPEHLLQFGVMGALIAEIIHGVESPRVGLLNIGAERSKGRDIEREAYRLLEESGLNFVGNVEGGDIANNGADVFVTDGFTGNVALKTIEGTGLYSIGLIRNALEDLSDEAEAGAREAVAAALERMNPDQYGGAHLIGTKGAVVIAHGSSSRVAIASAVRVGAQAVDGEIVSRLEAGLDRV